jgi:hypothetical protein
MIYGLQVLWKCGLLLSDARLFIKTRCRSACTISIMLTYPSSRFGVAHSVRGDLSVADQKFVMAIGQVRVLLPPRHRGFQFWQFVMNVVLLFGGLLTISFFAGGRSGVGLRRSPHHFLSGSRVLVPSVSTPVLGVQLIDRHRRASSAQIPE